VGWGGGGGGAGRGANYCFEAPQVMLSGPFR
jgi:hypothetical protein